MKQMTWLYELQCPHCQKLYQLNVPFVYLRCTCGCTFTPAEAQILSGPALDETPAPDLLAARPA